MHIFPFRLLTRPALILAGLLMSAASQSALAGGPAPSSSADPAFDRYVDLKLLTQAWADRNAPLLTDLGLQLAEGERVLFRSHNRIKADQVLAMAAKAAAEKKDVKTLARLGAALESLKKAELVTQVAAAQRLSGVSRAPDKALAIPVEKLTPEEFLLIRDSLNSITAAKIAEDREMLDVIMQLTPKMTQLSEAQRKHLVKIAAEARASLPDTGSNPAAEALDRLLDMPSPRASALASNALGVSFTATHKGMRVTRTLPGGATVLGKGVRLNPGDLILRVGEWATYGTVNNLDGLVDAATRAGNATLLVYDAKTRQVKTLNLVGIEGTAGTQPTLGATNKNLPK